MKREARQEEFGEQHHSQQRGDEAEAAVRGYVASQN